jgi:hypothetical protein
MVSDRQGNPVSGATAEAVGHFDEALLSFNIYRGDPLGCARRSYDRRARVRAGSPPQELHSRAGD